MSVPNLFQRRSSNLDNPLLPRPVQNLGNNERRMTTEVDELKSKVAELEQELKDLQERMEIKEVRF